MKKARLILTAIVAFTLIGAAFAFKANSFNLFRVYRTTTAVTTLINGSTYTFTAPTIDPFCTYTLTNPNLYTTVIAAGTISTYRTSLGAVVTTYPVGTTIATFAKSCPTITGWVTTLP